MEKSRGATKRKILLTIAGLINYKKLNKAAKNYKKAQENTLRGILTYAKDTEWGKAHHFDEILKAKTDDELYSLYQKYNPICEYKDFYPYIVRSKKGEENLLFPGKPLMYATTSGTTSEPKFIPITKEYYENIYSKMTKVWLYSLMKLRKEVLSGMCVSIVGKTVESYSEDGTPIGSVSGLTQGTCPDFVKQMYVSPSCVFSIKDYKARYYVLMRMGIEYSVSLVVTANPSTVNELIECVNENIDEMIKDIENGTLSDKFNVEKEIRDELQPYFKKNPQRAAFLRKLHEKYQPLLPKHYWPDIQVLNAWKNGNTYVYLDKFKDAFPKQMIHVEFGYFATECRAGLCMDGDRDSALFPHMHYFEFIKEEDLDNTNPKIYQLKDLEQGGKYAVLVTTYGGLYRYNMSDLILVNGSYKGMPTIRLLQKINGIISMTGEKLAEKQFTDAVESAKKETGDNIKFFIGFADLHNSVYNFYFEGDENFTEERCEAFTKLVDKKLMEENMEYNAKRVSFRVKDPIGHRLVENAFENYKAKCINEGARDGQFKLNLLLLDEKKENKFKELIKK